MIPVSYRNVILRPNARCMEQIQWACPNFDHERGLSQVKRELFGVEYWEVGYKGEWHEEIGQG